MSQTYRIRILRDVAPAYLLTEGDYAEVVDLDLALRDDYDGDRPLAYADAAAAMRAGNAYCNEAPSHPVYGAPGCVVEAAA